MSKGFVVWLTGLSGAGKTTIADRLAETLRASGLCVELVDGDHVRQTLCADLGYSKEDRDENVRRIGFVAGWHAMVGRAAIVSAISPYAEARARTRDGVENYVEVFVDCGLDVLVCRDPKGLYKKALSGVIPHFTGVSDPYERPEHPDVHVLTDEQPVDACVAQVVEHLSSRNLIPRARPERNE